MRRSASLPLFAFVLSSLCLGSMACSKDSGGLTGKCKDLDTYVPTAPAAPSFATAVYPILSNTMSAKGCAQATICHGTPPFGIDPAMTKTLSFVDPAATVKGTLLNGASVNAPSMKFVMPGDVGASFLAFKISGKDGLNCVASMCTAHASVGTMTNCGDPMPTAGVLTDAERTTILDWIATGAMD